MSKKIFCVICAMLCLVNSLTLVSCGNTNNANNKTNDTKTTKDTPEIITTELTDNSKAVTISNSEINNNYNFLGGCEHIVDTLKLEVDALIAGNIDEYRRLTNIDSFYVEDSSNSSAKAAVNIRNEEDYEISGGPLYDYANESYEDTIDILINSFKNVDNIYDGVEDWISEAYDEFEMDGKFEFNFNDSTKMKDTGFSADCSTIIGVVEVGCYYYSDGEKEMIYITWAEIF